MFILILLVHVGAFGKTDSNSLTSVHGFKSVEQCQKAGESARALVSGTVKELRFVCVSQ